MKIMTKRILLLLSALPLFSFSAFGQAGLNATVYPGYTFSTGDRLTADKLNLLGRPTIYISGTLGGTNVGLAAGSVTGVQLADTVINTNRFQWDTSSPRGIDLKTNVITSAYLATNSVTSNHLAVAAVANTNLQNGSVSSNKLAAGFTFGLTNLPPGLTNKLLWADTNGVWSSLALGSGFTVSNYTLIQTGAVASATYYATNSDPFAGGLVYFTNSFTATPAWVRVSLLCVTNTETFVVGDELNLNQNNSGGADFVSYWANSNRITVSVVSPITGMSFCTNTSSFYVMTSPRHLNWRLKVAAGP